MNDILGSNRFVKAVPIEKGLSHDKKYYVETVDGQRLLLRISDAAKYDQVKKEYEKMRRMDAVGDQCTENPHFITGCIRGYFGSEPPDEFLRLNAFYMATGSITSIPWAFYKYPSELGSLIKHNLNILRWFDNMKNPVPTWYLSGYEVWDVLDADGNKTGRFHERGKPMAASDYHLEVHVWIKNDNGEYLISQRSPNKLFPNMWECTGGSAIAGDDSLTTALKETKEELGIIIETQNGRMIQHHIPCGNAECHGLIDVWLFRQNVDISTVTLAPDETCDVMWANAEKIRELMASGEFLSEWFYPYFDEMVKKYER